MFVKEAKHQMVLKNVLPEQQFVCFSEYAFSHLFSSTSVSQVSKEGKSPLVVQQ